MQVKDIAEQCGVSPDTVRYYTRIGLLKPSQDPVNRYRLYSQKDHSTLRFAVRARQLGFSLDDIQTICSTAGDGASPCPTVRELMRENLQRTEAMFQEIKRLRDRMRQAVAQWESMPNCDPTGEQICSLIENWDK
ncbi:MerR family transcriptional regulator [Aurantivibrio plasticivorans]